MNWHRLLASNIPGSNDHGKKPKAPSKNMGKVNNNMHVYVDQLCKSDADSWRDGIPGSHSSRFDCGIIQVEEKKEDEVFEEG